MPKLNPLGLDIFTPTQVERYFCVPCISEPLKKVYLDMWH